MKADDLSNDTGGYYSHPAFSEFIGDREYVSYDEIKLWAKSQRIEVMVTSDEFPEWTHEGAELVDQFWDNWKPEPPDPSWAILHRSDDEDGGIHALWYRPTNVVGGE